MTNINLYINTRSIYLLTLNSKQSLQNKCIYNTHTEPYNIVIQNDSSDLKCLYYMFSFNFLRFRVSNNVWNIKFINILNLFNGTYKCSM